MLSCAIPTVALHQSHRPQGATVVDLLTTSGVLLAFAIADFFELARRVSSESFTFTELVIDDA
jgi:hypothetical protein